VVEGIGVGCGAIRTSFITGGDSRETRRETPSRPTAPHNGSDYWSGHLNPRSKAAIPAASSGIWVVVLVVVMVVALLSRDFIRSLDWSLLLWCVSAHRCDGIWSRLM